MTAVLALGVLLCHAWFLVQDERVCTDDVEMLSQVPVLLSGGGDWMGALSSPGGWWQVGMALWLDLVGVEPWAVRLPTVLATVLLVLNTGLLLRWGRSGRAAVAGMGLVCLAPMVTAWGRMAWYHLPEAALLTGALVLWTRAPRLERTGPVLGMALLVGLALTLRASALLWSASLLPAVAYSWRHGDRRRLGLLLGLAGLAALLPLASVVPYVWEKLSARDRYVFAVDGLGTQVSVMVTWVLLGLGLGGAGMALRRPERAPERVLGHIALGWLGITALLVVVFRAGLDNHTLFAVGLAMLGARTLEGRAWLGPALFAVQQVLLWTGLSLPGLTPVKGPDTRDYNLPSQVPDHRVLGELFDATCASDCVVAVEQGLFHPFSKGAERLEVLQTGAPQVSLVSVRDVGPRVREVAALASLRCTKDFVDYHRLNPGDAVPAQRLERQLGLGVVWTLPLDAHCTLAWEMASAPPGLPPSGPLDVPERRADAPFPPRPQR